MTRSRERVRILYLIDDLTVGGAQRALLSHAGALDHDRYEVHVASLELIAPGRLEPAFRQTGITVHALAAPGEAFGLAPLRFHSLLQSVRPDIVHTHLTTAGITGRIAARSRRIPHVVSTLHSVPDWTERRGHPLRVLDRRTLRLAERVCAVSNAVRDAVVRCEPTLAARTLTLRHGVALEQFGVPEGGRNAARVRLGFAPADFVVGSVARLEPCKGIATLLRAAGQAVVRAPMLQVLVVGNGSERPRLEHLAESLGIGSCVTFTGTRDDVPQLLAAVDVFAVPSRSEGLGVVAIEALAAGLPVLASRVGGLPEIVEDGVCGKLLPPDDVAAWADELVRVAIEPARLAPWREEASKRARAFSIEASVAELERLYGSLPEATTDRRRAA